MKLPIRYNYAEAYLTLRCNLGCSYCINDNSGVKRNRKELSADEWAKALNRIDFGETPLTLGGGEPTLYKGFYNLLDKLKPDIQVDLLTNLTFNVDEFIKKTKPERFTQNNIPSYKSIRASFHPEKHNPKDLVDKAAKLQNEGFQIGIFALNHPKNMIKNMEIAELARKNKIYFFIKDFLGWFDGQLFGYYKYPKGLDGDRKLADCRTKELLIAPDGEIYRCHRDLYHAENPVGHLLDENFEIQDVFRPCKNYGLCNPCDLKLKTNRFFQMGNCSVEIIENETKKI